jgi:hypothetical protein
MTELFTLIRVARVRALLILALVAAGTACRAVDQLNSSEEPITDPAGKITALSLSETSFRGGIPFGMSSQPTGAFGEVFNGAFRNIWPEPLLEELAEIKRRGGKVVLMFAGHEMHYQDRDGHFDMGKWKARVDRFKGVDFTAYINDGTIVGHYLIDEPYDPVNWHGRPVPGSVVEEMAKYSKQLWPTLVTIVRAQPNEVRWNGTYRYLDAAWAQYATWKGDVTSYIRKHVADAQEMGLGLVVGLNVTKGGLKNRELTAKQVEDWGSTLLSSTYPCAFISWEYREPHIKRDDVVQAMKKLAQQASNRPARSCRADGQFVEPPPPPPPPVPEPDSAPQGVPDSTPAGPDSTPVGPDSTPANPDSTPAQLPDSVGGERPAPTGGGILLTATDLIETHRHATKLTWSGARSASIDLYRDGAFRRSKANDGLAISLRHREAAGTHHFQICESGTTNCSNIATITFQRLPIGLTVGTSTRNGRRFTSLQWSGVSGRTVDLYRNGQLIGRTGNDGGHTLAAGAAGARYRVCQSGTSNCSGTITAP